MNVDFHPRITLHTQSQEDVLDDLMMINYNAENIQWRFCQPDEPGNAMKLWRRTKL